MEKIIEQGILYDFYGALLTKHQQEIYEAVVYENLSLGEIAAEKGISRQGVHDLIKRCDKILEEYEQKLHLVERFSNNKKKLMIIRDYISDTSKTTLNVDNKADLDNKAEADNNRAKISNKKEMLQLIDDMIEEL